MSGGKRPNWRAGYLLLKSHQTVTTNTVIGKRLDIFRLLEVRERHTKYSNKSACKQTVGPWKQDSFSPTLGPDWHPGIGSAVFFAHVGTRSAWLWFCISNRIAWRLASFEHLLTQLHDLGLNANETSSSASNNKLKTNMNTIECQISPRHC